MWESLLPDGVAAVAAVLAPWPAMRQFYLSGGTALTLQCGHRSSRDLDFFSRAPVSMLPELSDWDAVVQRFSHSEWLQRDTDQIRVILEGVSVTFLAYPFSHTFPFQSWRGLAVADIHDIAAQKAYTVGRRATARNYLDLHEVLCSRRIPLEDVMRQAQQIYRDGFSPRLFLQQLTYTCDLTDRDDALSLLTVPQTFEAVAQDLQDIVRQWMQQQMCPRGSCDHQGPR